MYKYFGTSRNPKVIKWDCGNLNSLVFRLKTLDLSLVQTFKI